MLCDMTSLLTARTAQTQNFFFFRSDIIFANGNNRMVALCENIFDPLLRRYLRGPSANPADVAREILLYWASMHSTSGNSSRHVQCEIPLRNLIRDLILLSRTVGILSRFHFNSARIQTYNKRIKWSSIDKRVIAMILRK
jgi:hypothetical protein